jgi:hypothetical protein
VLWLKMGSRRKYHERAAAAPRNSKLSRTMSSRGPARRVRGMNRIARKKNGYWKANRRSGKLGKGTSWCRMR